MEIQSSGISVQLCLPRVAVFIGGGSSSTCRWGFTPCLCVGVCLGCGRGVGRATWNQSQTLIRVACKYLRSSQHSLLTSDAGGHQKNEGTQADPLVHHDKYLDGAFREVGHRAAGKWLWPLCPKDEITNVPPFPNTRSEVRGG